MKTTLIRVQRKRTKGFKMPENTVCVNRPTRFGNPFKLSPDSRFIMCYSNKHLDYSVYGVCSGGFCLSDIVDLYKQWITGEIKQSDLPTPPDISCLRGKNLACFCSLDKPCHADILLKLANA